MNNHDVGARSAVQAANEEGDGSVHPTPEQLQAAREKLDAPTEGQQAAPGMSPQDIEPEATAVDAATLEAARLAAAQAERLRARAELEARSKANAAEALASAVSPPVAPTAVAELHVLMMSDGTVQLRGPINDPERFMALIAQAFFVLHNHTVTKVRAETEAAVLARQKVPFMKRVFSRPGKAS